MFLAAVGAKAGEASAGRQMPSHWGSRRLNIFTTSSPTGSECLPGVGVAEAGRYLARPESRGFLAATSGFAQGRGLGRHDRRGLDLRGGVLGGAERRLHAEAPRPLPRRGQRLRHLDPGRGEHARRLDLEGRPRLPRASSSPRSTAATSSPPTTRCSGPSPTAASGRARPSSTPTSSAPTRTPSPTTTGSTGPRRSGRRTPSSTRSGGWRRSSSTHGILDAAGLAALKAEVDAEVTAATDAAIASPQPGADELFAHVYSPDVDPTSRGLRHRGRARRSPGTRRRWST